MEPEDPDDPLFVKRNAEAARMLRAFDAPNHDGYSRLAEVAQSLFDVPIALVTVLDEDRLWFRGQCGIEGDGVPRAHAFCRHAIVRTDVMIIEDASVDPRFANSPIVTGPPDARFYAGAPLITRDGARLGTFCIIDRTPRRFDQAQCKLLENLAYAATRMMEQRFAFTFAEEALRSTQAESARRARLSARFAHDFRTPLSAILGFSEILIDAPADAPIDRQRLAAIQDAARTLSVLSERYMTASAAAGGLLDLDIASTDLKLLATEVCSYLRDMAAARGVDIQIDAPDDVAIATDPLMMKRALTNLLSNAVKYTRPDTTVRLRLRAETDGGAEIAVSDSGTGLDPEDIAELTGAYARSARLEAEEETDRFGLGLSLIHDLLKRLRGDMDIESGTDGTTIALRFPASL